MPTPRETILLALLAALKTVPDATVLREDVLPGRIPSACLVILRAGDPGIVWGETGICLLWTICGLTPSYLSTFFERISKARKVRKLVTVKTSSRSF